MSQHALNSLKHVNYFFVGQPILFSQHFLADQPIFDIGVIDGSFELEQWEFERKLFWKADFQKQNSPFIGAALRSLDGELPMIQVLFDVDLSSPKQDESYISLILSETIPNSFSSRFMIFSYYNKKEQLVQFKNMNNEQDPGLIRTLKGHKESIMSLDMHPTCKYIASAGMDNIILLWDLTKQSPPKKLMGHKNQINDLKFSPTGAILVSASSDESIKFWEVEFDIKAKQVTLIKAHSARIRSVAFSCDGLLLASCGDDKLVKVWSTVDRRLQFTLKGHKNWVRYCQFSPTATNVISCDDKLVHIWDLNTKKPIQTYQDHSGVIHMAKFHSLGNCIASGSHDKKIKLYDLRSQHVIQVYEGHEGPVKSIDFHPHCPYVISSSEDGTTKIWNSQKGRLEYTLESHSNQTKFSRQGDYFISGGSDKTINIWKTGFYDSLKQKMPGTDNNIYRKKVIPNLEKQQQNKDNQQTNKTEDMKINLREVGVKRQPQDVLYNHQKQNFQLMKEQQRRTQASIKSMLPAKFLMKLQRINNQIDFITKTTQILETRVINNGEQLQRIISLAEME